MYPERYHDVAISASGFWRILHKAGLGRLPTSQRHKRTVTRFKRHGKQRPGHQLQVDVKSVEPLGQAGRAKKYHRYTAIDDCTRLRVLRAYPRNDPGTAIDVHRRRARQTALRGGADPDRPWPGFGSALHWHLLDQGIGHGYTRPRTPRPDGKVERSHRIDSEEFHRLPGGQVIDDAELFTEKPGNGRTTTTSTAPMEPSAGRRPTNDSVRKPKTRCHEPPSVAHLARRGRGHPQQPCAGPFTLGAGLEGFVCLLVPLGAVAAFGVALIGPYLTPGHPDWHMAPSVAGVLTPFPSDPVPLWPASRRVRLVSSPGFRTAQKKGSPGRFRRGHSHGIFGRRYPHLGGRRAGPGFLSRCGSRVPATRQVPVYRQMRPEACRW
jgi:hypothetical protein